MADDAVALSGDQEKVLWALSLSGAPLGEPATPEMVVEGFATAYGDTDAAPEMVEAQLQSMVEIGVVERHVSDAGVGFSMTFLGWDVLGI